MHVSETLKRVLQQTTDTGIKKLIKFHWQWPRKLYNQDISQKGFLANIIADKDCGAYQALCISK
jgi:hypothetical protein